MRLKVRDLEVELKPLTFKDWVEAEKQGFDINRMGRQKRCEACGGTGKDGDNACAVCKGKGRTTDVKMQDMWYVVQMTFARAGVPQAIIDDLSLQEVMDLFGDGAVVNFISAKGQQAQQSISAT